MAAMWLCSDSVVAQSITAAALAGSWEIEGTIMGDEGDGWVLPHKHSAPDCGKDYTLFLKDHTAKEIKYADNCNAIENEFTWKLDGNTLALTKGERKLLWHILSNENGRLKVGIQPLPGSANRIYMVYRKRE